MRIDRLSWDDVNMLVALSMAQRSPDPSTQVGAYITSADNKPLGMGYNGVPRGIKPSRIPWAREGEYLQTKYPYIEHAERNAMGNATADLTDGKLYVTLQPCDSCARAIIQAGIKEVIYLDDKYKDQEFTKAAIWMLSEVDIPTRKHKWSPQIALALTQIQDIIHSMV